MDPYLGLIHELRSMIHRSNHSSYYLMFDSLLYIYIYVCIFYRKYES